MPTLYKSSFNAGVLSPRTGGRIDLQKYESALGTCENMLPQPWGGVTRRMGTEFINECSSVGTVGTRARLIPFRYSTEQAYIIEAGKQYMRFYMDGGRIQTNDASTLFLCHFDGARGSTAIKDSSTYARTVAVVGGAKIDTSDGVFNQCVIFSSANDYCSLADSADWNYSTNIPFTFDTRVKFSSLSGSHCLYSQTRNRNYLCWFIDHDNDLMVLDVMDSGINVCSLSCSWTAIADKWYHAAIVRGWGSDVNKFAMSVNGLNIGSVTINQASFPAIASTVQIGNLHSLDDFSKTGVIGTYNGNAAVSTTQYKMGGSSLYLDGTDDFLSFPDGDYLTWGTDDFTVDCWVRFNTANLNYTIFSAPTDDAGYLAFVWYGTTNKWLINTNAVAHYEQDVALAANTWYHIALVKTAGKYRVFRDGVQIGADWADVSSINLKDGVYFGTRHDGSMDFGGYIDEFRISKGIARWTVAFTPQTTQYFSDAYTVLLCHFDRMTLDGKLDEYRISKWYRWTDDFTLPTTPYPLGTSGGNIDYSISSDFQEVDLRDIYFSQSADTLYLAHPDYPPATLVRANHDDWTLADITFVWPPFQDLNVSTMGLNVNAASVGAVTVLSNYKYFDDTYIGAYYNLRSGYLNVASVQSATSATGIIIDELTVGSGYTTDWAKSAWDEVSGYPSCVTFFEQRLSFGASNEEEQTIWMSVSGDFYNFKDMVGSTIADTDACTYTLDADEVNKIHFLVPSKKLVAGTEGGIFLISGNQDDGITPSNIKVRIEAAEQAADECMPVRFGNSVLFAERGKSIIREFAYNFQSDSYEAKDLIILAEHLTRNNSIVEMALQRIPFKVLWCVLDDGKVISLTYLKEHDVVGWTWHDFGGDAESVACIPGTTDDEVWFIIKRTIGGSVVRYIERLKPNFTGENEEDAFYVDCGLTYDSSPTTSISGLTHLTGETVMFLADGNINQATVVNASGKIFLDSSASVVQVGLPVESEIETLRVSPAQYQGKEKRISYVTIRFFETAGEVKYGIPSKLDTLNLGTNLFTGDQRFTFPSGYDQDGKITIKKTDSFPMTILAIIPDIEMYRD